MQLPTWLAALALAFLGATSIPARAETYPSKPIRLIVPFAPGGTTDVVARSVAVKLSQRLNQPVVVDNRPGAGGSICSDFVAKSAPDGYTLLLGSSGTLAYNPSLYPKLPYNPVRSFSPVSMLAVSALIMVSPANSPITSARELIRLAKASPGKYTYASAGTGAASHVGPELFSSLAGIQTTHVPYKGSGPATLALVGGETSFAFTGQALAWPLIAAGKLRAVGIASDHRSTEHPEVPTIAESGLPKFDAEDWFALLGPAGLPDPVVKRLNAEVQAVLKEPDLHAAWVKQGIEVRTSSPEQLRDRIRSEGARWGKVIRDAHIQLD
jgi:tripartite-type tricarboxylate transporter receptor subunit TctC